MPVIGQRFTRTASLSPDGLALRLSPALSSRSASVDVDEHARTVRVTLKQGGRPAGGVIDLGALQSVNAVRGLRDGTWRLHVVDDAGAELLSRLNNVHMFVADVFDGAGASARVTTPPPTTPQQHPAVAIDGDAVRIGGAVERVRVSVNDEYGVVRLILSPSASSTTTTTLSLAQLLADRPDVIRGLSERKWSVLVHEEQGKILAEKTAWIPLPFGRASPSDTVVAVLDDGVDPAELGAALVDGVRVNSRASTTFHGTSVAALIAGELEDDGSFVNNGLKVMPVAGVSEGDLLSTFESAADYVCAQRDVGVNVRVVNMSVGSHEAPDPVRDARWRRALEKLAQRGIVVVVAGPNPNERDRLGYPGRLGLPNVVVATDVADVTTIGDGGSRVRVMGTSFAAPIVASALAKKFRDDPRFAVDDAVALGRSLRTGLRPWEVRLPDP